MKILDSYLTCKSTIFPVIISVITKTCLFKYTENFTTKNWKFSITKTYLYKVDPLTPHFYIVKLGFTGVYIIFLISA